MSTNTRAAFVANDALNRFPNDPYQRIIHYTREATMEGRANPHYSPKIITPFFIGHAGYGKTSRMREYAQKMGIGYRERKLAGIVDIAEIFGMYRTDPVTGLTYHAKPDWWPNPEEEPEGIIVWDDATRCLPHIMNAIMQMWIDGRYNDLVLPDGWSMVCTGNPEEGYQVMSMDGAMTSRTVMLAYNRPNEVFYEQLERQNVHADLKNLWMKDSSQVDAPVCTISVKPENNDRLKMMFARIYPYLEHDDVALNLVANTMFGPGFLTALHAMRAEHKPFEPEQILNEFDKIKDKLNEYVSNRRTDIVSLSTMRLITYLTSRTPDDFTDDQFRNVAAFGLAIPEPDAKMFIDRVTGSANPNGKVFGNRIIEATRVNGKNGEFAKRMADLTIKINQKLNAAGLR